MLQRTDDTHLEKEETPSQNWEGVLWQETDELILSKKIQIITTLTNSDGIIFFEDFVFYSNNFCLYFKDWLVSDAFQNTPFFKAFRKENSILYNDIYSLLESFDEEQKLFLHSLEWNKKNIKKIKKDVFMFHFFKLFYKAYLELKKLWATNWDLLGFNA